VKAYEQNDARRRIHGPERQRGEEHEAVVHKRNDHEHHNRNEKKPAGADLVAPFVRRHSFRAASSSNASSRRKQTLKRD